MLRLWSRRSFSLSSPPLLPSPPQSSDAPPLLPFPLALQFSDPLALASPSTADEAGEEGRTSCEAAAWEGGWEETGGEGEGKEGERGRRRDSLSEGFSLEKPALKPQTPNSFGVASLLHSADAHASNIRLSNILLFSEPTPRLHRHLHPPRLLNTDPTIMPLPPATLEHSLRVSSSHTVSPISLPATLLDPWTADLTDLTDLTEPTDLTELRDLTELGSILPNPNGNDSEPRTTAEAAGAGSSEHVPGRGRNPKKCGGRKCG
eukprot:CAMPEP_0175082776 /NCGR_PEP_ID=MMETSP0052_2-20121109/26953_1 /TAXON_ID=51329 ORGANISM="Polytomella parva, Strain SAG 63-3" /NCGR_SAMPLE_ID=MMETSP0052_2 /ASSEMBLY_ACC=CAM_ASM_000194 /LENGTH=261 /DNA_ID=CAMNT_0016354029 /DNA_START=94 /DNA_END=880 /DNA_ORIENTATION=+